MIIAHRCNTAEKLKEAFEKVDVVEIDLNRQGNSIVVTHDEEDEEKTTLAAAMNRLAKNYGKRLILDVKKTLFDSPDFFLQKIGDRNKDNWQIASESLVLLSALRTRDVDLKLGWTCKTGKVDQYIYNLLTNLNLAFISLKDSFVDSLAEEISQRLGVPIYVFTVNSYTRIVELLHNPHVTGVFTDYP